MRTPGCETRPWLAAQVVTALVVVGLVQTQW
jgi:hypothetical protein